MLVHSVYFWLEKNLTHDQRQTFHEELEKLRGIEVIRTIYIGKPAPTDRPAVDRTYDVALTILLDDMNGHDIYQKHPLHRQFLDQCSGFWTKVVIYDHQALGDA